MKEFLLDKKIALITGGNGGIGFGISEGLLKNGATVVIAGRNQDKNDKALEELRKINKKNAITDVFLVLIVNRPKRRISTSVTRCYTGMPSYN